MTCAAVVCQGLYKGRQGRLVLSDLTFWVAPGETVGLVGPNGCGKTTTLDIVTGFLQPDKGSVTIFGKHVLSWPAAQIAMFGVGRTFQDIRVPLEMEVGEVLALARRMRCRAVAASAEGLELEASLGIDRLTSHCVGSLSYGQRKAVALACALVRAPRLLVLDEPFAALDPAAADRIADVIRAVKISGTSILLVDHNQSRIGMLSDRMVELHGAF